MCHLPNGWSLEACGALPLPATFQLILNKSAARRRVKYAATQTQWRFRRDVFQAFARGTTAAAHLRLHSAPPCDSSATRDMCHAQAKFWANAYAAAAQIVDRACAKVHKCVKADRAALAMDRGRLWRGPRLCEEVRLFKNV